MNLRKIDYALRGIIPVAACVLFLLLTLVPWPWPLFKNVMAALVVLGIAFWVLHRPDLFPMAWSFGIGFLQDMLLAQPLGVSAFTYLVLDILLRSQRRFFLQLPFLALWAAFVPVIAFAAWVPWAVASLLAGQAQDMQASLLYAVTALLLFPLSTSLFTGMQHGLLRKP